MGFVLSYLTMHVILALPGAWAGGVLAHIIHRGEAGEKYSKIYMIASAILFPPLYMVFFLSK